MHLLRCSCLALIAFLIAGCDTQAPVDEIVGTWRVESYVQREMGRSSETQVILDLDLPATGAFEVQGAKTATLRYARSYDAGSAESRRILFTSYDPDGPTPDEGYTLEAYQQLREAGLFQRLILRHIVGSSSATLFTFAESPPYLFSENDAAITVNASLSDTSPPSEITTIEGTLTLGNRTLRAGEEAIFSEDIRRPGVDIDLARFAFPAQYTFSADGSLTIVTTGRMGLDLVETGTWERAANRLNYTVADSNGTSRTAEHEIVRRGSQLVLANETLPADCDAACRFERMQNVGGAPETLQAYWVEFEIILSAFSAGTE